MTNKNLERFLSDTTLLLQEMARQAKADRDAARGSDSFEFQSGYLMAYHAVISLLKQQGDAFGISQEELGLADIDPERDLL